MMKSVLFVCLGNICRSPAAEIIFRDYALRMNAPATARIDSAGELSIHQGSPPDHRMARALTRRGYQIAGLARPVVASDFVNFDVIVTMDDSNYARMLEMRNQAPAATARIRKFSDFLNTLSANEIPDPYYGGEAGFEHVIDLLEDGAPALFRMLEE